jgi:succinyl-CoA synthetase beta subunit
VKIHEFQAKELFRKYGIPVPKGRAFTAPDGVAEAAEEFGCPVFVKAQVHAGGRGKGGGVRRAGTPSQAREAAEAILGSTLVTAQTGEAGRKVRRVLVEKGEELAAQLYAAVLVDRRAGRVTLIASAEGGVEIEKVAAETPEKIHTEVVDPVTGLMPFQARRAAYRLGLEGDTAKAAGRIFWGLSRLFHGEDASLVEVNPLGVLADGSVLALDAKISFDDSGLFRHKANLELRDPAEEDPREREAREAGLSYIALDGDIGCLVNGAGLAMATMDIIAHYDRRPANFLDVGGGASKEQVETAFKIILRDPNVKAILVNIFGGIMRCDVIAEGIVGAARELGIGVPLVVRLEGTNAVEGKAILDGSGLTLLSAEGMDEAARKVVELVDKESKA